MTIRGISYSLGHVPYSYEEVSTEIPMKGRTYMTTTGLVLLLVLSPDIDPEIVVERATSVGVYTQASKSHPGVLDGIFTDLR